MDTIKVRRGTSTQWSTAATVLAAGEPGWDSTLGLLKVGDGTTAWASLRAVTGQEDVRWLGPQNFSGSLGSPAIVANGGGSRFPSFDVDPSSNEQINTSFTVPQRWGHFSMNLYWTNRNSGSGDVVWSPTYSLVADAGSLTAGDVVTPTTATAPAQNVLKVTQLYASIATGAGAFHLRLARLATDVADTLANDAGVLGILLSAA